jgi:putative membrane protein
MNRFNLITYRIFVNLIGIGLAAMLFTHININSFFDLAIGAIILTILNLFLKPVLLLITLPLQIMSFGIFYLITNAIILKLTSYFITGFHIDGFWAAVGGSIIIGLVNIIFDIFSVKAE